MNVTGRRQVWSFRVWLGLWGLIGLMPLPVWGQEAPMNKKAVVKAKVVNAAQPISLSEEYRVGRAVAASILQDYPLYQDPPADPLCQ